MILTNSPFAALFALRFGLDRAMPGLGLGEFDSERTICGPSHTPACLISAI